MCILVETEGVRVHKVKNESLGVGCQGVNPGSTVP